MRRVLRILKANRMLFLILLLATLVRFVGLIPNIAHTDEAYIIKHSRLLFYSIITKGDFDPHAYKYGSLIFYLQALVYLPFYLVGLVLTNLGIAQSPPTEFQNKIIDFIEYAVDITNPFVFAEGRALTAILGVLSVFLLYFLGKRLFNRNVGLLAAFILAVNPFYVRDSHYITTDVPFVFLIILSFLFMANAALTSRLRWYLLSGLFIGISSTIKYFPVALLAYPIAIFLDSGKEKNWFFKIILGSLMIPLGVVIGVPFLFVSEGSRSLLQYEVGRELLWYGTPVTQFLSAFLSFIFSFGKSPFPNIAVLIPSKFTAFHSSFLSFRAFGVPLLTLSLIGALISSFKFPLKTLFLITSPLSIFIYISFYIPAVFERLSLPIVPFLCLFAAVFFLEFFGILIRAIKQKKIVYTLFIFVFIGALYYPFTASFASSWSCSENPDASGAKWIDEKIPNGAKIAQVSPLSLPTKRYEVVEVRPDTEFFLSELQERGFDYLFMNTGIMTRFNYQFENKFFIIPPALFRGYFVPLSLQEYENRVPLLAHFDRHPMCDPSQYFYYEIPRKERQGSVELKNFSFKNGDELNMWTLEDLGKSSLVHIQFAANEGHNQKGALEYSWTNIYYRGPRVMLDKIPVVPSKVYTFSGWLKSKEILAPNERDGFLRIDFYTDRSNTLLPGETVALSPRTYGESRWQKTTVTAKAPENTQFAILSLQVIGTKNINSFYFDDIEFLEGEHE